LVATTMIDIDDCTILLIEDDLANIEMLEYLLTNSGFKLVSATRGVAGIELAEETHPDIILLDIMMPGIDGFETCRRLKAKETTRDIPVIFITARTDTVDKVKGFKIGAVDYIIKPFQYEEVIARVRSHVIINRQRREIQNLREQDRVYYEKLSRMKDEVMNTASHDLKNPLTVILTSLNLLKRHGTMDDERGQELMAAVETSARQMRTLISDLLDLARIETGQGLLKQEVSLYDFLKALVDGITPLAEEKNITVRFMPPEADRKVTIDINRMGQVVNNLLSNAVKYTLEGGHVELVAQTRPSIVLLQVRDNGLGIPEKDLPHVFEKFYRIHREDYLVQDGTGLGLSIARSIVEQHGGEIWVESTLGEGTTFYVTLIT
jgi:two-component system sensor histidine kinase/response regulator